MKFLRFIKCLFVGHRWKILRRYFRDTQFDGLIPYEDVECVHCGTENTFWYSASVFQSEHTPSSSDKYV